MLQDVPDEEIEKSLVSHLSPPHLSIFKSDGKITGQFIVADGVQIDCCSTSGNVDVLELMALYYILDLEYPRVYSQLLGILQTHLLKLTPYSGAKSTKFRKFSTDLQKKMAEELDKLDKETKLLNVFVT